MADYFNESTAGVERTHPFHVKLEGCQLTSESDKAYRILDGLGFQYWVPKSICCDPNFSEGTVWIHREIYNKILSKAIGLATR